MAAHERAGTVRRRRRALAILIGLGMAALAIALAVPAVAMYQRLHPARVPLDDDPARHGLAFEDVTFHSTADDTLLSGWHVGTGNSSDPTVVIAPGIDNNRLQRLTDGRTGGVALPLAGELHEAGFQVLLFDLRGEGESGGDSITFGVREAGDVSGAVRWATASGSTWIGVLGFSLGAAASLLAAATDPDISAVIADSSFANLHDELVVELGRSYRLPAPVAEYPIAWFGVLSGYRAAEISPERAMARLGARPVLIIQGTADETVPMEAADRLFAASAGRAERWIVPGGTHAASYYVDPDAYVERIVGFFGTAAGSPG